MAQLTAWEIRVRELEAEGISRSDAQSIADVDESHGRLDAMAQHTAGPICDHCGMNKAIRNPSGYCDHLYYPEACPTCNAKHGRISQETARELLEALKGLLRCGLAQDEPLSLANPWVKDAQAAIAKATKTEGR